LNRRSPSSSGPALRRSVRLTLERLEDRWVPSAFSYDSGTQTLTITGSTTSANQFQFDQVTYCRFHLTTFASLPPEAKGLMATPRFQCMSVQWPRALPAKETRQKAGSRQ
jgi:hypothetical protein